MNPDCYLQDCRTRIQTSDLGSQAKIQVIESVIWKELSRSPLVGGKFDSPGPTPLAIGSLCSAPWGRGVGKVSFEKRVLLLRS